MMTTAIILRLEGNWAIWHKYDGLAKNEEIARWMFKLCGWETDQEYPYLSICIEVVECKGDVYFPGNQTQLWVLGSCLYLN